MANEVLVETYEIEEAEWAGDQMDKDKYESIIAACDLSGQKEILALDGAIPFQKLSGPEVHIWRSFCPGTFDVKTYRQTVIPIRVLGLVQLCIQKGYFERIQVWTEHESNPDPVVVGLTKGAYDSDNHIYLIARWGHALLSWPEVVKEAARKWKDKEKASLERKIAESKTALESLDALAGEHFAQERYWGV